jgi:alkylhydroperoxidase/carboxymuconolactone decarboxylase family protein YurZ
MLTKSLLALRPLVLAAFCLTGTAACDWMQKKEAPGTKTEAQVKQEQETRIRRACASASTFDRLKELAFDEAARIRNQDPRELDALAAASVVRMENPVPTSRDEALNVTVCRGRFILELPPGVENAFDGQRRLSADIEYAAQAAADGSGLVYHMEGAEPIVYRLATAGGVSPRATQMAEAPQQAQQPAPVPIPAPPPMPHQAEAQAPQQPQQQPRGMPAPQRAPESAPAPAPKAEPAQARTAASPSFNCRYARSRSERLVCSSGSLAAKDRQMASIYYAAMANGDTGTRSHLRRSRDAFLARRDRCGSAECVDAVYSARIQEIRRIAAGE